METPNFTFKPLQKEDLPLMLKWHNEPHVKRWYDKDKDLTSLEAVQEEYAEILDGSDPAEAFIILADTQPIGYIQTYLLADNPEYAAALGIAAERKAAGLDLFIGNPELIGKGFGSQIIKKFLGTIIFSNPLVEECVIGPEPANLNAIHAYEKVGFVYTHTAQFPGEPDPEYIMTIKKPTH